MRTFIKVCGTTNLEDARAAFDAGADSIGFIFAESSRRISPEDALKIQKQLPRDADVTGVFVNEPVENVARAVRELGLRGVQLHGEETPEYVTRLRDLLGKERPRIVKAITYSTAGETDLGYFKGGEPLVDAIMVDSGSRTQHGGTGQPFDWVRALDYITPLEERSRIIIAGGLSAENVSSAIALFRPWGVDAVTSLEREKGKKDHDRVRAFVAAVRQAEQAQ